MTTDTDLIFAIRKASSDAQRITLDRKLEIEIQIEHYESACILSRGPNKQRAAHWSGIAFTRGRELQRLHKVLTGRDWITKGVTTTAGNTKSRIA
jgi:hypothetical protein